MNLGKIIKQAREEAGLSQVQLASLLKTTQQRVSEWEVGKREPSFATLMKVSRVLNKKLKVCLK